MGERMAELTQADIAAKKEQYEALATELDGIADELIANGVEIAADGKAWYRSKMFWVNAFALGTMGMYFAGISPMMVTAIIGTAAGFVNIYLRASSPAQPLTK
jgi:F0F1-type ATP synthase assembly protein I